MSQERLAELADLSVTYIGQIERAERHFRIEAMMKIAAALEVTADSLLCGNQNLYNDEFCEDLNELVKDCGSYEKQIIFDTVSALKNSLQSNGSLLSKSKK